MTRVLPALSLIVPLFIISAQTQTNQHALGADLNLYDLYLAANHLDFARVF